jgi:hypothetical protein
MVMGFKEAGVRNPQTVPIQWTENHDDDDASYYAGVGIDR